jgi:hypothetical protein
LDSNFWHGLQRGNWWLRSLPNTNQQHPQDTCRDRKRSRENQRSASASLSETTLDSLRQPGRYIIELVRRPGKQSLQPALLQNSCLTRKTFIQVSLKLSMPCSDQLTIQVII